jgi:hypothetical protein
MLSKFAKLALVATSFAPVLLTLGWIRFLDGKLWPEAVSYGVCAVLTVGLCLLLIRASRTRLEAIPFRPKSVSTADAEIVGFVLAYLLPFIDAAGVSIRPGVFWFVMGLLALAVWSTNSYHVNPVLGMLGFHFYEVTVEGDITFVLITRKNLRETGKITEVVQLTEYMVLELRDKK